MASSRMARKLASGGARLLSGVALCCVTAATAAPNLLAQRADTDSAAVVLAALTHLADRLPSGRVVFDPRDVCTATLTGWRCPEGFSQSVEQLDMALGSRDFTYLCMPAAAGCQLVGADVLVDLSNLRVLRGSASMIVNIRWVPGEGAAPLLGRRRVQLHLRRDDDLSWRVTRETTLVPDGVE